MKTALIALTIATLAVFATIGQNLKLRAELKELKELKELAEINTKETTEHQKQYSSEITTIGTLAEPSESAYADIFERIEMLRQHLPYQPSAQWIENVINSAEIEIRNLQIEN